MKTSKALARHPRRLIYLALAAVLGYGCASRHSLSKDAAFLALREKGKNEFKKDYDEQNFAVSVKYLEEAEKIKPDDQEVHYYLAYTYERLARKDGSHIPESKLEFNKKSSEQFKKVIAIAPKYAGEILISDPYTKLSSIWGAMAMAYLSRAKTDSAIWAFKYGQAEGGYFPAILEFNKNILRSCETNAIIFTNGDNDTFPMWFLQLIEGFRKDVNVINLSLFNSAWYIKQLKNAYPFGPNNIPAHFSDSEIEMLAPIHWSEDTVEVAAGQDSLNPQGKIRWLVQPTLMGQGLRVQDMMLIDVIATNQWKRPIYFSTTVASENRIGLDSYLTFEGLVFRLKSHQAERIDKERTFQNCFKNYTYDGIHDQHHRYSPNINDIYTNYHSVFARLAVAHYHNGEFDRAKFCLETMKQKIPEKIIPYVDDEFKAWVEKFDRELSSK